jgi:acetyltransferase-like isoleucine patch superfamily enzyme
MSALRLRLIYAWDRARFARFRRRWRERLVLGQDVSVNLRMARLRIEPGGRLVLGDGVACERQPGNHLWVQRDASIQIGDRTWLRTEYGANRVTAFEGASIQIGPDALINGAMVHAKSAITIGCEARLAFGVRILDADLHDLDAQTPERIEPVQIGDRVWIGADSIVLRGVTIGDDVVVGAGSIVTKDLPSGCLALGRPAVPVRDIASRIGTR